MAFIAKESSSESQVAFSSLVFLACFRIEHFLNLLLIFFFFFWTFNWKTAGQLFPKMASVWVCIMSLHAWTRVLYLWQYRHGSDAVFFIWHPGKRHTICVCLDAKDFNCVDHTNCGKFLKK